MSATIRSALKTILPGPVADCLRRRLSAFSRARTRSNEWLRDACADVEGEVLSIGSGSDTDGFGGRYRDYFPNASRYVTSELEPHPDCELVLDIRSMPEIESESWDAIFCSGVLEHVDEFRRGFDEITRILKPEGILLLGLPFRQEIHMQPHDFWRFTRFGIEHLLRDQYTTLDSIEIDPERNRDFPAAYWFKVKKCS